MTVEIYEDSNGKRPFQEWFWTLKDTKTQARIETRLRRLNLGQLGDYKVVGPHLLELRLHWGPGYRIYCSRLKNKIILLLCGGDKRSQKKDIQRAIQYLADYQERS